MNFKEGLQRAYNTKWTYINTFTVQFDWGPAAKAAGFTEEDRLGLNINIKNCNTPQYTNQSIEVYTGDRWFIHNGRNEMWKFTMTFRDHDQLSIYRKFVKLYAWQKTDYFDNVKNTIILYKDSDYIGQPQSPVFEFHDVMIESIGSLSFSNETEAQIAEFDVQFKTSYPEVDPFENPGAPVGA